MHESNVSEDVQACFLDSRLGRIAAIRGALTTPLTWSSAFWWVLRLAASVVPGLLCLYGVMCFFMVFAPIFAHVFLGTAKLEFHLKQDIEWLGVSLFSILVNFFSVNSLVAGKWLKGFCFGFLGLLATVVLLAWIGEGLDRI